MSDRKLSRAPIVYRNPPSELRSWLDVKRALPKVNGLSKRTCADCVSALNTIGKLHRLPGEKPGDVDLALARMEADPRLVTKYLDRMKCAQKNLRGDSWNNVAYRVRLAMEVTGAGPRIGNRARPLSVMWERKFGQLAKLPYQAGVGSFVRWLDAEGIRPESVNDDVLKQFGDWLHAIPDLRQCPRTTLLATRRTWNAAADAYPAFWPQTILSVELKFQDRYLLPWSAFAPSFYKDVERRTTHVVDPPLDDPDARPAIAKHVAQKQEYEIQRLASALVAQTGRDPKTITCIADLVQHDAFVAILQFLQDRVRKKDPKAVTSGGLFVTAQFLCGLARNWVKVGEDQLKILLKIACRRNPNPAARGKGQRKVRQAMTPKNRGMLGHFRDPEILARFLELPSEMFKRVLKRLKQHGSLKRKDAVVLGWAFAVSLLQIAPVRPKNGSGIELGRNLIEQGFGPSRQVFVHWVPEEVKNGVELQFELTGEVLELFDLYMTHGRPLLCGPANCYLFPGRGNGSKQTSWFSTQIAERLQAELGVRVTGHQFRHLIGFIYLREHPGDYESVRQFLGHTDIATTVRFYAGIEMKDAAKALDATIKARRAELAGKVKRPLRSKEI
jgi:integrase